MVKHNKSLNGYDSYNRGRQLCTFKQKSIRFSEFVEIYFDFAPFINNYEEKQEIDIEKW